MPCSKPLSPELKAQQFADDCLARDVGGKGEEEEIVEPSMAAQLQRLQPRLAMWERGDLAVSLGEMLELNWAILNEV